MALRESGRVGLDRGHEWVGAGGGGRAREGSMRLSLVKEELLQCAAQGCTVLSTYQYVLVRIEY